MTGNPEGDRLEEMAARIQQAEKVARMEQDAERDADVPVTASRIGFDFVGTVGVCAVVGWLLDYELRTQPWILLAMLGVGFIAGATNVWRALGGYSQGTGWMKKSGGEED